MRQSRKRGREGRRPLGRDDTPGGRLTPSKSNLALDLRPGLENLTAPIHAGLEIDVVRPPQFPGILVFDIGRVLQRIGRTAHSASGWRRLSFGNGHSLTP